MDNLRLRLPGRGIRRTFCFCLFVLAAGACDGRTPNQPISTPGSPRIHVERGVFHLGTVKPGEHLEGSIEIGNRGTSRLEIFDIETSCGCTVVTATRMAIPPGESAILDVEVDTKGKAGEIRKTVSIHSNDPEHPVKTLTLGFKVDDPVHGEADIESNSIFGTGCRECHVAVGEGLLGVELYQADCSMCHRPKDVDYSPGLPVELLRTLPEGELRTAIEEGVPGTSMPGFLDSQGGPLNKVQIQSLIDYLQEEP